MTPKVRSGQLCTVTPVAAAELRTGDVVLCRVRGAEYLHLIKAVKDERYQIGNNHGRINGWVGAAQIFGKLVRLDP